MAFYEPAVNYERTVGTDDFEVLADLLNEVDNILWRLSSILVPVRNKVMTDKTFYFALKGKEKMSGILRYMYAISNVCLLWYSAERMSKM